MADRAGGPRAAHPARRVKPFALHETMLPAAALVPAAQSAIERFSSAGGAAAPAGARLPPWLRGAGRRRAARRAAAALHALRLRFNDVLSQFDLFPEVITQRSEHETGVWLSGLDVSPPTRSRLPGGRSSRRR